MGSVVRFRAKAGDEPRGKVTSLRLRHADVLGEDGNQWSVPYAAIRAVESTPTVECTLREVEQIAQELINRSVATQSIPDGWTFRF